MTQNTPYNFTKDGKFEFVKDSFTERLNLLERDQNKLKFFEEKVVPSIAYPLANGRYGCIIEPCVKSLKPFANKHTYFRHLQTLLHRDQLPGGGRFLTPNSNIFGSHVCSYCKREFSRKDKLVDHLKTNKICSQKHIQNELLVDDSISSVMNAAESETNEPLETRDTFPDDLKEETQQELIILTQKTNIDSNEEQSQEETSEDDVEIKIIINEIIEKLIVENIDPLIEHDSKLSSKKRELSSYSLCGLTKKQKEEDEDENEINSEYELDFDEEDVELLKSYKRNLLK
jgi:hypothetical protein